jgi:hypothetical protein
VSIEDRNYYSDYRVRAGARRRDSPIKELDESRMLAGVMDEDGDGEELLKVPFHFGVCETCDGRGSHVNPSIDSGGLSADDFAEDPDFAESYFRGAYDVTCYTCDGRRVTPILDWPEHGPLAEAKKRADACEEDLRRMRAEQESERRMGA